MKKKVLCLLLVLAVVMSVVPLTAFAKGVVPEEYRGTYKATTQITDYPAKIIISENSAYVEIPDVLWDCQFSYLGCIDLSDSITLNFRYDDLPLDISFTKDHSYCYGTVAQISSAALSFTLFLEEKVSDSTNSTLSTGSDIIIPAAVGILALGAVIFIGKRKTKEETE